MKITSNEYITIKNFIPFKVIELYRNNKKIHTITTQDTTANLKDIKRHARHERKKAISNAKLAIKDENNNIYKYTYFTHFKSIGEEYCYIKQLKAYLEKQNANAIQVQTAAGIVKEYVHKFTIIHI